VNNTPLFLNGTAKGGIVEHCKGNVSNP